LKLFNYINKLPHVVGMICIFFTFPFILIKYYNKSQHNALDGNRCNIALHTTKWESDLQIILAWICRKVIYDAIKCSFDFDNKLRAKQSDI